MRIHRFGSAAMIAMVTSGCGKDPPVDTGGLPTVLPASVLDAVSPERMKVDVDYLAAEELGGRIPGSFGHDLAMEYILDEMQAAGLTPLGTGGDFVFPYPSSPTADRYQAEPDGSIVENAVDVGYDLVGLLPGSDPDLAGEYIVVMAHYDHLGVTEEGDAYNGAFDNAGGVAVLLELARVLVAHDSAPPRSMVFLITDDEEAGLDGARNWVADPTVPVEQIVMGISVDPAGRRLLPDYDPIVVIGLERSPALEDLWRDAAVYGESDVVFMNRDMVPVFSSDQDTFYDLSAPIPACWFVNPGMSFYHTTEDTADTIDYRMLRSDVRFLAQVLTLVGRDTQRYDYAGPPHLGAQAAQDATSLLEGVLTSEELTYSEREQAAFLMSQLAEVIAADDIEVVDNPDALIIAAAYFLLFELTGAHPGDIPPPFPE